MACWICGVDLAHGASGKSASISREHLIKASDVGVAFPRKITQQQPLYFHRSGKLHNKPIGSVKNNVLKSNAPMCKECNGSRTQRHDESWSIFHDALRRLDPKASSLKTSRIFKGRKHDMLGVQLFFAKNLGCRIVDDKIPLHQLELKKLAQSIISNKPCENLYLSFHLDKKVNRLTGSTSTTRGSVSNLEALTFSYCVDYVTVRIWLSTIKPVNTLISYAPQRKNKRIFIHRR